LSVKLHPDDRPLLMADGHDLAVIFRLGVDLQAGWQRGSLSDQRSIAANLERGGYRFEYLLPRVPYRRRLTMQRSGGPHNPATQGRHNRLMPQTNPQHRYRGAHASHDLLADPRLVGRAGTGRKDNRLGPKPPHFGQAKGVVPAHQRLLPQLAQVASQVMDET